MGELSSAPHPLHELNVAEINLSSAFWGGDELQHPQLVALGLSSVPHLLFRRVLDHVRIGFHLLTPGKAHVRLQVLLRQ